MKVCISCIRKMKKPNEYKVTQSFLSEMIEAGMPESMTDQLIDEGRAVWTENKVDCEIFFVAEIIGAGDEI